MRSCTLALTVIASALLSISCTTVTVGAPRPHSSVGPPPHAPAHGYRHKHANGAELRFDASSGVYVVIGRADTWWADGLYLRIGDGGWQASLSLRGPWEPAFPASVPPGLAKKHGSHPGKAHGKQKQKKTGKGRGAAKIAPR